jgi:hypothetical protein
MGLFPIIQVGEQVRTTWRELFSIKFLHAGYENPNENFLSRGIQIIPDEATQQLFAAQKMRYRFYTNTLVCFIECVPFNPPAAEPKIPFIPITGDWKIRFLVLSSSAFAANTFVVAAGSKQTYQFTNKTNNQSGGLVFLTAPVENHATSNDYEMGTVVQSSGNLFASLKTVAGADNIAISDTNFWKQLQPLEQVVNNADLQNNSVVKPATTCFAVIDMYKNGATDNSYRLFDTNDQLFNPAPVFTIKFASRF